MKGRLKSSGSTAKKGRLLKIAAGCLILLVPAAAGFNLTKEKAKSQETKDTAAELQEDIQKKENKGWELIEENPLKENMDAAIEQAVHDYYEQKTSENGFAEGYNNLTIYLKKARYEDCYIAFVKYTMKIKDIYTEVPGMETLYLRKEKGKWQILSEGAEDEILQEAEEVASHDDVQQFMAGGQQDYAGAVASDAMLAEVLTDLEQASSR